MEDKILNQVVASGNMFSSHQSIKIRGKNWVVGNNSCFGTFQNGICTFRIKGTEGKGHFEANNGTLVRIQCALRFSVPDDER